MNHDYEMLIDRLAAKEPKNGFTNIAQISLTPADVGTVVKHDPDVLNDAMGPDAWTKTAIDFAYQATTDAERHARLGMVLETSLLVEAKVLVLVDVQDECARRELLEQSVKGLRHGVLSAVDRKAFAAARGES
jgi:hypothetical protein